MGSVERRILENIRKVEEKKATTEDSELQMYATEPPGAMGEGDDDYAARLKKAKVGGMAALRKKGKAPSPDMECEASDDEMEFTIDEDSPLDENEWMTLDEMDLTCEACAGRMRKRKMTRIKRSEAQECIAKFGKNPDKG